MRAPILVIAMACSCGFHGSDAIDAAPEPDAAIDAAEPDAIPVRHVDVEMRRAGIISEGEVRTLTAGECVTSAVMDVRCGDQPRRVIGCIYVAADTGSEPPPDPACTDTLDCPVAGLRVEVAGVVPARVGWRITLQMLSTTRGDWAVGLAQAAISPCPQASYIRE